MLIDEAHHASARTWRGAIEAFPQARKVLFTATPFRRDRKEIPGAMVYTYPLARALEAGIYCPIDFVPLEEPHPSEKDDALAERAIRLWLEERDAGRTCQVLIRTDRGERPVWCEAEELTAARFDLHVFYYHDRARLLFICTTASGLAKVLRSQLVHGYARRQPACGWTWLTVRRS